MLIKITSSGDYDLRCSAPVCFAIEHRIITGDHDHEPISTSYAEGTYLASIHRPNS